jgi:UDP-N-acetylglucosamine--N-acetylmuramyl-(pentapeptide) pyrophosphoryl-undecaprenol N-acetylglucosamine transferase
MNRILFAGGGTGGHLYPAIALANACKEERPDTIVHFVGARRGVEARVLPTEKLPHTLLPFEPLRRSRVWENWRLLPSFLRSGIGLSRLFGEFRPMLVVGTGGYASAPACAFALLKGVPIAVQEQNSYPGLTTRVMSRWASQVHLGFPEASRQLKPGPRTEVNALGNPIRPPDFSLNRDECRQAFGLRTDSAVVLVVGGSQGSRAINETLLAALAGVPGGLGTAVEILWATGPNHYESIQSRLSQIPAADWVKPFAYINEMPKALRAADIAVSRAGAMATAELLAWGIPAILIPLPTAAADHQTHNARALSEAGAALMLLEKELTGDRLWQDLEKLTLDAPLRDRMAAAARERARPNAARDIATKLLTLLDR